MHGLQSRLWPRTPAPSRACSWASRFVRIAWERHLCRNALCFRSVEAGVHLGRPGTAQPTEWHVLEVLVRHEGKLVSQRDLLQEVWGPQYETETNYLRVYMAQLRRKLEPDPSHPRHLITEPGIGYRFERGAPASK
jgi:DNA-binding response OmpR family regulator